MTFGTRKLNLTQITLPTKGSKYSCKHSRLIHCQTSQSTYSTHQLFEGMERYSPVFEKKQSKYLFYSTDFLFSRNILHCSSFYGLKFDVLLSYIYTLSTNMWKHIQMQMDNGNFLLFLLWVYYRLDSFLIMLQINHADYLISYSSNH